MHTIIRHSLLASIQTIRAALNGMESIIKYHDAKEEKEEKKQEETGISAKDEEAIAKILGLDLGVDNE